MKTTNFVFGAFLALFLSLTSCSTENATDSDVNQNQIKSLVSKQTFETVEDERLAFTLLSNDEKYQLWVEKIESIIKEDGLKSDQISYLNEVKAKLKPSAWDKNDSYHAYFTDIYLPDFILKVKSSFTDAQMTTYFYRVGRQPLILTKYLDGNVTPSCNCLKSEATGWDCGVLTDSNCKTSKCKEADGCGAFNMSFCDGRCS
jgi:hypothetical protein